MTTGRWVAPVASRFAATRREFTDFACTVPGEVWEVASPVEGWRFRDVLAHVAEGDTFLRMVVQAVLDGSSTDLRPRSAERETRIRRALERGMELTIDKLIARASREGEFTREVLSRLTDEDATKSVITSRSDPTPMTLQEFLDGYHHDEEHLAQLRDAKMVHP